MAVLLNRHAPFLDSFNQIRTEHLTICLKTVKLQYEREKFTVNLFRLHAVRKAHLCLNGKKITLQLADSKIFLS